MMLRFVVWTVLGWGALGKPAPSPMKVASVESHNDGELSCQLDPMVTVDSPPIVKILSNITYKYALEARFSLASIFPKGICDNYESQSGRFDGSLLGSHSVLRPELYGLLCGKTCTISPALASNITAHTAPLPSELPTPLAPFPDEFEDEPLPSVPLPDTQSILDNPLLAAVYRNAILRFRANAFVTQMLIAFNATPQVWRVLCNELDASALDTMFSTDLPKVLACEMVNITANYPVPSKQQFNPSAFSFNRLLRVNGELLGGAARASFSSSWALRQACVVIGTSPDVHARLELLDISWQSFHTSLCSGGQGWLYRPPTPEQIWRGIELAMVNVFTQSLWLSGSSNEFRKLICEGHNSDYRQLTAFNRTALQMLSIEDRYLDYAIGERCNAVDLR